MSQTKKYTKGFPEDLPIPTKTPVCPGCAQGKMPASAHPPSESRATAPFERVHSDLKSFPVVSYHKYKYFISFFDDYTSYAWIVLLREKSGAITALKQFMAMVKTQYKVDIKEWMSDAGGEFKSDAFLKTLKDTGIKILQSARTLHNRMGALNASCALLWIRLSLCDLKPAFLNLGGNLQSSTHCIAITGLCCVAISGRHHTMY